MDRTETSGRGTANVCAPNEKPEDEDAFWRFLAAKLAPHMPAVLARRDEVWIDQYSSPLSRRRHVELARQGAFPAHKEGRRWRALRADVDAYIRSQPSGAAPYMRPANDHPPAEADDPGVRAVLGEVGLELAPKARARRGRGA